MSKDDIAEALNHIDGEHQVTDIYIEKNWQNIDKVQEAVLLYLKVLDIADEIKKSTDSEKEELHGKYAVAIFEMCSHYEAVYRRIQEDMEMVRKELLAEFQ